ncbi:MAG: DUF5678 domain-containing protein [Nitrososphaera sp.]|nr:DUF5678 domain-containing protein [Nitrososphaera sp.]
MTKGKGVSDMPATKARPKINLRPQELKELNEMFDSTGIPNNQRIEYLVGFLMPEEINPRNVYQTPSRRHREYICHSIAGTGKTQYLVQVIADMLPDIAESWDSFMERIATEPCPFIDAGRTPTRNPVPLSEYERGKRYYQAHNEELERRYPGEYIAIWNNEVISHGQSFGTVAQEAYDRVGYQDMYIPKVGRPKRIVRAPAPRLIKKAM